MTDLNHEGQTSMDLASPGDHPHLSTDAQLVARLGHLLALDGKEFITLVYKGRPAWLLPNVADAIDMSSRNMSTVLRRDYADELEEGEDFCTLKGQEFRSFRDDVDYLSTSSGQPLIPAKANSITLLYEPALFHILNLTRKTAGIRLRKTLRRDILPGLFRGQAVSLAGPVDVPPATTEIPDTLEKRKIEVRKIAEERRSLEARIKAAQALGDILTPLERKALILGGDLAPVATAPTPTQALPEEIAPDLEEDPTAHWKTVSQIAREHSMTPKMVGRLVSVVQDRGQPMRGGVPGISEMREVPLTGKKGSVETNVYSPEGEALIVDEIRIWKAERSKETSRRYRSAQDALYGAHEKLTPEEFDGLERIIENWRDGLGVDFVIATQVRDLVKCTQAHGLDVAQQAVLRGLNTDIPHNASKRLKVAIKAAVKAASKTG